MWLLYFAGMYIMVLGIRISSIWNTKSKQWITGRKNWKNNLQSIAIKLHPRIWFHVSSLGEFEQARPVIEQLKKDVPSLEIILTFFSPSGYLQRKDYNLAHVFYLPADLPGNAEAFLSIVNPDVAVFTKYDLWPGFLHALQKKNIPSVLISAHWIPGYKWSSGTFPLTEKLLKNMDRIFLQRGKDINYFHQKGFTNIAVAGDTRVDRSLTLDDEALQRMPPRILNAGPFDIVAGSTWPEDEELLFDIIEQLDLSMIIAPHDVSSRNIERLISKIKVPYTLYSALSGPFDKQVLVIDSIGLLSILYVMGNIAYVGGGFGKGIHNILEPAAHKKPVIFGPHFKKFAEAVDLIDLGGAWSVKDKTEMGVVITSLLKENTAELSGKKAYNYLTTNAGATMIVSEYIYDLLPIPKTT